MQAKINIHCFGGTGISVGEKVVKLVQELGDGFAEIKILWMDTSLNSIKDVEHNPDDMWLIKSKSASKEEINGSGGERHVHAMDAIHNIKEYIDKYKLGQKRTNEYNIVIASASGGTGSILMPLFMKSMLERDIPVTAIIVGDSSNGKFARNTLKTMESLYKIVYDVNKPLSVAYVNNHAFISKGIVEAEKAVNNIIFQTLSALSLFLSGQNESLDYKDMENMFNIANNVGILENKEPDLYGLCVYSKEVNVPEGTIPMFARTLTVPGVKPDIDCTLLHYKIGYVTQPNALDIYKDQLPLHLMVVGSYLNSEMHTLTDIVKTYSDIVKSISAKKFVPSSGIDDESGLAF